MVAMEALAISRTVPIVLRVDADWCPGGFYETAPSVLLLNTHVLSFRTKR